nr:MAG TPA: hypothetical protein [Inoviridae sp.]
MWKRLCIMLCAVFCATLCAVPAVFADDTSADSSASSAVSSSDSTFLGDAGELNGKVSDNFADGVDKVKDDLTDVHGSLHYNLKDEFPQFCKEALSFVPEAYWWAFSLAILFGFVLALYRRMT